MWACPGVLAHGLPLLDMWAHCSRLGQGDTQKQGPSKATVIVTESGLFLQQPRAGVRGSWVAPMMSVTFRLSTVVSRVPLGHCSQALLAPHLFNVLAF